MKKMSIPAGPATPQFALAVKDNLEVMAGRRGNKISLPTVQDLTFSSPPTQAECQALNTYVNEWAKTLKTFILRFDEG